MTPPLLTCSQCAWREPCGGTAGQMTFFGCFSQCRTPGLCEENTWACPCRGEAFHRMAREVGGLNDRDWAPLRAPDILLPPYVPVIRHGKKREIAFAPRVASISISDLLPRRREESYYPVARTPEELRDRFGLARETAILVSGVARDDVIELFWAFRNVTGVPRLLAGLGIDAMTMPNFSFFREAPRTHTLYNRKRLMIVAEELSAAGIAVIPHLNAITDRDWETWRDMLAAQPGITSVAKEFQTGNRAPSRGMRSIGALRDIQERIGRPLHPVAIGGGQYVKELAAHFDSYTVVDSHPFMCAVKRRELTGPLARPRKIFSPRSVDMLLARNVKRWEEALLARTASNRRRMHALRIAV